MLKTKNDYFFILTKFFFEKNYAEKLQFIKKKLEKMLYYFTKKWLKPKTMKLI